MSLLGVDTSQLISQFTTTESQNEWADVEAALKEAFPDQSMEEIHAEATAILMDFPDIDMDDLVKIMAESFSVSVSSALASEIRDEWEEFSSVSGLSVEELVAVLDDYDGDSVDTNSAKYLMMLFNALREELDDLAGETEETEAEADEAVAESDYEEAVEEKEKLSTKQQVLGWITAAATAVVAGLAICTGPLGLIGGVALMAIAGTQAYGLLSGEAYGVDELVSDILQAIGMKEGTADTIGDVMEVLTYIVGIAGTMGLGTTVFTDEILDWISDQFTWGDDSVDSAEDAEDAEETDGTEATEDVAESTGYELSESELTALQEAIAKLVAMLKSGEEIDAAMLDAIFNALKDSLTDEGMNELQSIMDQMNLTVA